MTHAIPNPNLARPVFCEEEWHSVTLSEEDKKDEQMLRIQAKAQSVYANVLQPIAYIICANTPSIRLAVLGISGWTLVRPAVVSATAHLLRATHLGG